jgi:hypothetical protein
MQVLNEYTSKTNWQHIYSSYSSICGLLLIYREVRVMVFNATFNNISVISWQSVLLVEEAGENH